MAIAKHTIMMTRRAPSNDGSSYHIKSHLAVHCRLFYCLIHSFVLLFESFLSLSEVCLFVRSSFLPKEERQEQYITSEEEVAID